MLRLQPSEAIHFAKSGHDLVGTVDIVNIAPTAVTYKIKTTSPEKFRVRPSSGVLAPGASTSINVVLLQQQQQPGGGVQQVAATLVKDKFLVMCMELTPDASTSTQDIAELWRVRCTSNTLYSIILLIRFDSVPAEHSEQRRPDRAASAQVLAV